MKIFNTENGVEKVYVQINDIIAVDRIMNGFSGMIESGMTFYGNESLETFVEISDPEKINFFRSCCWILDFKKVQNYSSEGYSEISKKIALELESSNRMIEVMSDGFLREKVNKRRECLSHYNEDLKKAMGVIRGDIQLPLPLVPDSDSVIHLESDEPYKMTSSIDPNKLLISRKDGEKITSFDHIPNGLLKAGVALKSLERTRQIESEATIKPKTYVSDDGLYYVVKLNAHKYGETELSDNQIPTDSSVKHGKRYYIQEVGKFGMRV